MTVVVVPNLLLWGLIGCFVLLLLGYVALLVSVLNLRYEHRRLMRRHQKLAANVTSLTLKTSRVRTGEQTAVRRRPPPPAPDVTSTTGRHHRIG